MGLKNVGLDYLLSEINLLDKATTEPLLQLPIEFLRPSQTQPRQYFQAELLEELAASIRSQGIIQPIIVRKIAPEHFEIIAGERRWRAAQLAGLQQVPVVVKILDTKAASAVALIENMQREDLNPLEEAMALKKLLENFGMTHQQAADVLGKSRTNITNTLRLLELADSVKPLLLSGELSMGHARALLSLSPVMQWDVAQKIIQQGLSVRHVENWVQQQAVAKEQQKSLLDHDTLVLQQQLSEKIGNKVLIKQQKKGSGQLQIHYNSLQELEGILQYFQPY